MNEPICNCPSPVVIIEQNASIITLSPIEIFEIPEIVQFLAIFTFLPMALKPKVLNSFSLK